MRARSLPVALYLQGHAVNLGRLRGNGVRHTYLAQSAVVTLLKVSDLTTKAAGGRSFTAGPLRELASTSDWGGGCDIASILRDRSFQKATYRSDAEH
jgi:hypothetical protein